MAQQAEVVEYPVATALGSDGQVAVLHGHVGHWHDRKVELQGLPGFSIVPGNPGAALGAGEKQAWPDDIGSDHAGEFVFGNAGGDFLPASAVIRGAEQVGSEVVAFVGRGRHVQAAGLEGVRIDGIDLCIVRQVFWRDVGPVVATVAADMYQAVVGSGPDYARLL